jgi:hypothetical protein
MCDNQVALRSWRRYNLRRCFPVVRRNTPLEVPAGGPGGRCGITQFQPIPREHRPFPRHQRIRLKRERSRYFLIDFADFLLPGDHQCSSWGLESTKKLKITRPM